MSTIASPVSFADRIQWDKRIKPALVMLAIGALGYVIGAYFVAPRAAVQMPTHMPAAYAALPHGFVVLTAEDGAGALLPVRIADTSSARDLGFRQVGEQAFANSFLLYSLTRETSARASYSIDGLRTPVEFAAIDASGTVISITEASIGGTRASIADRHQWLLVAQSGTLARFGITVGSTMDPTTIVKF